MIRIINDTHLGATRKAGTTPVSQQALRLYMQESFSSLLWGYHDTLVINGDLFDSFTVDPQTLIFAYEKLHEWLQADPEKYLVLVCGNHDWSPKGDKVSSFHLLAHFLVSANPDQVKVIDYKDGLTHMSAKVWVLPHMANQDLFNIEIEKACRTNGSDNILLLHANFENNFADHSDHSLNVFESQTDALIEAGWTLVFAHEHQYRKARDGRVVIVGNQIPTSVADCLGPEDKYYAQIDSGKLELVQCLHVPDLLVEMDWRDLNDVPANAAFVRVTGSASSAEASDMVDAIWNLRQSHDAFVVANAVKVEGMDELDELAEASFEDMKKVDVLDLLLQEFTDEEKKVIKELLA